MMPVTEKFPALLLEYTSSPFYPEKLTKNIIFA